MVAMVKMEERRRKWETFQRTVTLERGSCTVAGLQKAGTLPDSRGVGGGGCKEAAIRGH